MFSTVVYRLVENELLRRFLCRGCLLTAAPQLRSASGGDSNAARRTLTVCGEARKRREMPRMLPWLLVIAAVCLPIAGGSRTAATAPIPFEEEAMPKDDAQASPPGITERGVVAESGGGDGRTEKSVGSCSDSLALVQAGKVQTRRQPTPSDDDDDGDVSGYRLRELEPAAKAQASRLPHSGAAARGGWTQAPTIVRPKKTPAASKEGEGARLLQRILARTSGDSGFLIGLSVLAAVLCCLIVMGVAGCYYGHGDKQLLDEDTHEAESRWTVQTTRGTSFTGRPPGSVPPFSPMQAMKAPVSGGNAAYPMAAARTAVSQMPPQGGYAGLSNSGGSAPSEYRPAANLSARAAPITPVPRGPSATLAAAAPSLAREKSASPTPASRYTGVPESTPEAPAQHYFCSDLVVPQFCECILIIPIKPADPKSFNVTDTNGNVVLQVRSVEKERGFVLTTGSREKLAECCGPVKAGADASSLWPDASAASNAVVFHLFRATGERFASLTSAEDRYMLKTIMGQCLHFWGIFEEHAINITDESAKLLATTEVCRVEFDSTGEYYTLRVAPLTDVGLVLCSLLCIHHLRR